jgi:hypothetical protein
MAAMIGLGRGFHRHQIGSEIALEFRRSAQFANVCPCNEGAAIAAQHDSLHTVILHRGFHGIANTIADMPAQRVDRWVVDGDDKNVTLLFGGDGLHWIFS